MSVLKNGKKQGRAGPRSEQREHSNLDGEREDDEGRSCRAEDYIGKQLCLGACGQQ